MYTYRAEILHIIDDRTAEIRLDLGFHYFHWPRLAISGITASLDGAPPGGGSLKLADLPPLLEEGSAQLLATTHKSGE